MREQPTASSLDAAMGRRFKLNSYSVIKGVYMFVKAGCAKSVQLSLMLTQPKRFCKKFSFETMKIVPEVMIGSTFDLDLHSGFFFFITVRTVDISHPI